MTDLEQLLRWERSGGTWELLAHDGDHTTVALLPCTGSEEMGRITSADADFARYVQRART